MVYTGQFLTRVYATGYLTKYAHSKVMNSYYRHTLIFAQNDERNTIGNGTEAFSFTTVVKSEI